MGRGRGDRLVADRPQRAVTIRPQSHRIDGLRPVGVGEHLVAAEHDAHRTLQLHRRHDRQEQVIVRPQRRAEAAAEIRHDHPYLGGGNAEDAVDIGLAVLRPLRLVVHDDALVAIPDDGGGVHLHRVVVLVGDAVFGFDAGGRRGHRLADIAARLGRAALARSRLGRHIGLLAPRIELGLVGFFLIGHADQRGGESRGRHVLGHHQRDGLAAPQHIIIVERPEG